MRFAAALLLAKLLSAQGGVDGKAVNSVTGAGIEGVQVEITLESAKTPAYRATTDSLGEFHISSVEEGEYRAVYNKKPGFASGYGLLGTATWGSLSVSLAPGFATLGSTRFSQYNTPTESQCGNTTSHAFVFHSDGTCGWTQVELNPKFMQQVNINGTGAASGSYPVSATVNSGIIKPWFATSLNTRGNFQCEAPQVQLQNGTTLTANATTKNDNNVFVAVTSITGTCNSQLAGGTSVAVYPSPRAATSGWLCTTNPTYHDQVLLFGGNNSNIATKVVQDACPLCAGDFRRANVSHIDTYSSSPGCLARDPTIQDLPDSYAVRLR